MACALQWWADGQTGHLENPAKMPAKKGPEPQNQARQPPKPGDNVRARVAAGEAATKVVERLGKDQFTDEQMGIRGGLGYG